MEVALMPKKSNLPAVVHDHFRKANKLHTYVEKELGEARNHALEIGAELLAAKKAVPHREWETECKRLFDGSLRSARFYMRFAKDMGALPKTAASAVLMIEGTLDGAAKAARAANPKPSSKPSAPKPKPDPPIDADSEPVDDKPPAEETPEPPPKPPPKAKGKPPKQFDRSYWYRQYDQAIGPLCRLVDKIANNIGESGCDSKKVVQSRLNGATEKMAEWMGVKPK